MIKKSRNRSCKSNNKKKINIVKDLKYYKNRK